MLQARQRLQHLVDFLLGQVQLQIAPLQKEHSEGEHHHEEHDLVRLDWLFTGGAGKPSVYFDCDRHVFKAPIYNRLPFN